MNTGRNFTMGDDYVSAQEAAGLKVQVNPNTGKVWTDADIAQLSTQRKMGREMNAGMRAGDKARGESFVDAVAAGAKFNAEDMKRATGFTDPSKLFQYIDNRQNPTAPKKNTWLILAAVAVGAYFVLKH
jgi:hypothetical protein